MKLITCAACGSETIGPKTDKFPYGMPLVMRFFSGKQYPILTKCRRCGEPIRITPVQFNGLPDMTDEQIEKYDIMGNAAKAVEAKKTET